MADEVKREFGSVAASHPPPSYAAARSPADADRKPIAASATAALGSPSPASAAAASPTVHKIQLKSADMKEEMQKEAFEISRVVSPLSPPSSHVDSLSIWALCPRAVSLGSGVWGNLLVCFA
jgi:hypothetical protein